MRIVLDTNVFVAGLLTPFGTCGEIVRMITSGAFTLYVDARILAEYNDVLRRPCFDIQPGRADIVIGYIECSAEVFDTSPLAAPLPDPDDASFLEVALAAHAECLVTGNMKHFPDDRRSGVRVLTPAEFMAFYKRSATRASKQG